MEIEIKEIKGAEVIPYLPWFDDIPKRKQVDSESIETIVVNMFTGKYHGLLGLVDGKPVGIVVYHMTRKNHVDFKFMYGREQLVTFHTALMQYLNGYGIASFGFESMHEPKLWNRIFPGSVKAIRTTYEFDVVHGVGNAV